jgi:uncharacterized membrane protein YedE/YeeE
VKRTDLVALGSGLLFALGLGLAGMTDPTKVVGFLDVAGAWDPSLAFVMIGAIGVHMLFVRRARSVSAPRFATAFAVPTASRLDRNLVVGALLFGIGWGIAGYCPGPVLVSLVSLEPSALVFVAAMIAGMVLYAGVFERAPQPASSERPGYLDA